MTKRSGFGSKRPWGSAAFALGLSLLALGCDTPRVGERASVAEAAPGPRVEIEDAALDASDHVVVTFSITDRELPVGLDEALALAPRFTLATLEPHPVDGIPSWKSQLLTGAQLAPRLPPAGPGTPDPEILTSVRQPGFEAPAALTDLGAGRFRYVFAGPVAVPGDETTIRVGVWLDGAPGPSRDTSATCDFRRDAPETSACDAPPPGVLEERETVLDRNCDTCHGGVSRHGNRTRVRLCLTCHTWQHSDPDTIDPAASGGTAQTDPNPLELGRLVHRIHRGRDLPTLYQSSSTVVDPDPLNTTADLPLPYSPKRTRTPLAGQAFSIVGEQSRLVRYGRIVQRTTIDGASTHLSATGIRFPRDYRDCAVCHEGAPQEREVTTGISRRLCSGCHPDIWYGAGPIADAAHLPHPGGPQGDDTDCAGCHVEATEAQPKVWAPLGGPSSAHVPPWKSERYNRPEIEIVSVSDLVPGGKPVIRFKLRDRLGFIGPTPRDPDPMFEPASSTTASPVPRRLSSLSFRIHGPNSASGPLAGDFARTPNTAISGSPSLDLVASGGSDPEYVYTFTNAIPATATGAWLVTGEARRYQNPTWSSQTNYTVGERVVQLTTYQSLQEDNQVPPPDDASWQAILTPNYSNATTYALGDLATRSGTTYRSLQADNRGHAPPSAEWWEAIPTWSSEASYGAGALVTRSMAYESLQSNNRNHSLLDPAWWAPTPASPAHYTRDEAGRPAAFVWPYTGETVNETAENPLAWVDTATGAWPPDASDRRRTIVGQEKCLRCHGRIEFHGGGARHEVALCLMCHTPDYAARSQNLGATYDGREERSLHLRVLVHRIHTGSRQGAASLEGIQPVGIDDAFFEGLFPNDLANCTLCHEGKRYLVESVPRDAPPTYANETGVVLHKGSSAHVDGCATPPITSACLGCHSAGPTFWHVGQYIAGGVETCGPCHEKGPLSVEVAHGLAPLTGPGAKTTFSSIRDEILVPRCASSACHSGPPPAPPPQLDAGAAYDALVSSPSGLVKPGSPEESTLLPILRGDAGTKPMPPPPEALLDPADLAAIEAWILNGAPND